MASSDDPPKPSGSTTANRRWPTWVFLAVVASSVLIWLLAGRTPAPPPPLPPGWTRLTTNRDGLLVDMPAEPTKSGPVETPEDISDTSWLCVADGYTYGVRRLVGGLNPAAPNPKPDDLLNGFCNGLKEGLGPDGVSWRDVPVGGRPGREMRHQGPKAASVVRLVQIERTLYAFLVGTPTPDAAFDGPDVMHFFDSVRFTH